MIAILEATFSPNCTDSAKSTNSSESDSDKLDDCIHKDFRRYVLALLSCPNEQSLQFEYVSDRLTREYITPNVDHRILETEAGKRFLYALRRSDQKDEVVPLARASFHIDDVDSLRRKRVSLRASLEELIIEYLQSLTPSSDQEDLHKRRRRRAGEIDENAAKNETASVEGDGHASNATATSDNSTVTKAVCSEQNRRIAQLDRIELEKALQNGSETEHNIRRLLNYR